MKDLQIQLNLTTTFNVVVENENRDLMLKKALEILNDNVYGIEFNIESLKVVGRAPKNFDSTV
tara:strand:+ start:52 stop:240 length:189 start_codon:yes stop_codon:yes gene_type:complete